MRRYGYTFMTLDEGDAIGTHYRAFIIFFGFVISTLGSLWLGLSGYTADMLFCMFVLVLLSMASEAYPETGLAFSIAAALLFGVVGGIIWWFIVLDIYRTQFGYWQFIGPIMWVFFHFSVAAFASRILKEHKHKLAAAQKSD